MFSVTDLELHPYSAPSQSSNRLDWRAPLTPQKYTKAKRLNRLLKSREASDKDECKHCQRHVLSKKTSSDEATDDESPPMLKGLDDYAFIRRDADYEPFVQEVWHDQIVRGWPKAIPYTTEQGINVAVRQCINFISMDDAAYYILLCGGIIGHASARQDQISIRNMPSLFHKVRVRAVQALRKDITRLKHGVPTDALMASILSFALQETIYDDHAGEGPGWPKSPMARAQLLSWAGGLNRQSKHLLAFYDLLERRGGLKTVTEPGLRRMIQLCDLLTSSTTAASPRYPLCVPSQNLTASGWIELDNSAMQLHQTFGSKFKAFTSISWQFLEALMSLLPIIRDVTVAIDLHKRTGGDRPSLGELVDFANSVHWKILCLGKHKDPKIRVSGSTADIRMEANSVSTEQGMKEMIWRQTLEPVRLAALIYSNLVIFPVAHSAGVGRNLAQLLRQLYESDQVRIYETQLEMWVLAMGCVASWGTADRSWFVEKLKVHTMTIFVMDESCDFDPLEMEQHDFLNLMRGFLWWEPVCFVPMREVWEEAFEKDGRYDY